MARAPTASSIVTVGKIQQIWAVNLDVEPKKIRKRDLLVRGIVLALTPDEVDPLESPPLP